MTQQELKHILSSKFDFENWKDLLGTMFLKIDYLSKPIQIVANLVKSGGQVGNIRLDDGRSLGLFKFEVADSIQIARNRKGLRDIAIKYVDQDVIHGALVFYYSEDQADYRLTFVSKQTSLNEDGAFATKETAPKRYTFLLGTNEPCTTAANRLLELINKKKSGSVHLADVTEAFSVERLNKDFFNGYKDYYRKFFKYINENTKDNRDYVKKLLGRLVFLQFLQKKGWMGVPANQQGWNGGDKFYLNHLIEHYEGNDRLLSDVLEPLFFNTLNERRTNDLADSRLGENIKIPYLNGGLFDKDDLDKKDIDFPYDHFKELMDFFAMYNFTIDENDPEDSEIGIDPEMLGHIFENLLEDNKDKGVFYTPKEIVQYMSQESVAQYLKSHAPEELHTAIDSLIKQRVVEPILQNKENARLVNNALSVVKVCDPAIGSGAFPMGVLNVLFDCRHLLYGFIGKNEDFSYVKVKRDIIQNNIYGVDIEKGAVDIARLRFWLALVVDENEPQPLPNLDFKIMQGNSLLEQYKGVDLSKMTTLSIEQGEGTQLTWFDKELDILRFDLREKLNEYYNCSDHQRKELLKQEIIENVKQQLREQSINVDFGDLDLSANDQFTLWHTWFYDVFYEGGFDIVIGNPPYIGVKRHKTLFDKIREGTLGQYFIGKMDYFYFFFHHTINILKEKGIATFITTNYYITADGAIKLRKHLFSNCCIMALINFGEMKLFENAPGQHNMITLFSKISTSEGRPKCRIVDVHRHGALNEHLFFNIINTKDTYTSYSVKTHEELFKGDGAYIRLNSSSDNSLENILLKISNGNETVRDICDINQGIVSGADYVSEKHKKSYTLDAEKGDGIFVLSYQNISDSNIIESIKKSERDNKLLKVFFKNSDISKYVTQTTSDKTILFIGKDIKKETDLQRNYPIIYNHLRRFRAIMIDKRQSLNEKIDQWFTLNRGTSHPEVFQREKIVCPQRSKTNTFGYNDIEWYAASDVFYLTNPKLGYRLKYILALLNSKLYYIWLYNRGKRKGESLELTATPLSEIPIAKANEETQNKIIEAIDSIQKKLKNNSFADIFDEKNKIDLAIYHLYDLTYDEVLIVDPETPITRVEYENE